MPQGNGIRRSKDLRARVRKFLILTNERKQMSTKTIKQRIALVAVSALTAGLFSVVSTPAANAVTGGYGLNVAAGTNPALAVASTLYIAGLPSISGGAAVIGAPTGVAIADAPVTSAARSLGLLNVSDLAGGLAAGTTSTATLLSTGSLSVYAGNALDKGGAIIVTGGTITATGFTTVAHGSVNSANTVAVSGTENDETNWGAVVKPNSGVTSMTIQYYSGYTMTSDSAANFTAMLASPTGATGLVLEGQIVVTIATASVSGVLSSAYSGLYGAANGTQLTGTNALTADAATYLGAAAFNGAIYFQARVRDGFALGLTSTTGILQVTATNGGLVTATAGSVTAAGTTSTTYVTGSTPDLVMIAVQAPSNAPLQTTVTVSYNGTVVGTKTVGFTGKVAKIELSGPVIGKNSATTGNFASYKLLDAAGNPTYTTLAGTAATAYPIALLSANAAAITGTATNVAKEREYSLATNYATVTTGRVQFTCNSTVGTGTIGLTYTNLDGSIVNSNNLSVSCSGDAVTYKASWDKASYIPGDIATLTITNYDAKGNVANDVGTITDTASATSIPVVAIGGLDKTITGPTTGDALDQGVIKYKYTVGATVGSYSGKVSFPTTDARYVSTVSAAGSDAVTVTLVVKESTASVSNADVLKSIVALIASINKQIQALQKLILKR